MTQLSKKTTTSKSNRKWIQPPNTIIKKGKAGSPQKLSYWIDDNNKPKLYTKKQLATCNLLMNLNFLLTRSLVLMDIIKTMDENTTIGALNHQDYAKFEASDDSVFSRFVSLISAVPDITFGEFLNFISVNNDPHQIIIMGQKNLKKVNQKKDNSTTIFYTSDRFKKE